MNNDLSVNFELISDNFQSIGKRKNTAILFDDFTNDGKREMFLGMQSGGLFYFFNDSTNTTTDNYVSNFLAKIYPNPSYKQLTIDTDKESQISIYSSIGQLVLNRKIQGLSTIDISFLAPSYYLIHIQQNGVSEWRKIIKKC